MPIVEEKKTVRYSIEYFNTRADWMGWNVLKGQNNFWQMLNAIKYYKAALEFIPEDMKLRIVETTRVIMDYDPNEDEE